LSTISSCSSARRSAIRSSTTAINWKSSTSSAAADNRSANVRSTTMLEIADKRFSSRLIVGTGKYSSPAVMVKAHEASGAEMITVAVRRVNISRPRDGTPRASREESLLDHIDTSKYVLLPNTAGCYSADEAIRTARLGRE